MAISDVASSELLTNSDRMLPASLSIGAFLSVPLFKYGRPTGLLTVAQTSARKWTADDISLVVETSEGTWAAIEHARAEAALRESEERLRDADRMKDQFLATLAHELRNPLAPIRNALHLLLLSGGKTDPMEVLDMLDRQVEHVIRLVDDLLEVSRITRGAIELKREALDLINVLHTAVDASKPLVDFGRHTLECRFPGQACPVHGDAVRLTQVFANLLNNATKYTDEGGRIELDVKREGDEVLVSVCDSGIGIADEQMPRLFEMFAQVNPGTTRAQGGLGIVSCTRAAPSADARR
jgi:signal transduction histidine kinase